MLNNVNLNLLRTLLVLLEECHVSRTASRLSLTQSAVSRQLAQLRELFDDPLLVRGGNELHKTVKAIALQAKVKNLLDECNNLVEAQPFDPCEWAGEVSFACSDYVAQYIFPDIVENISQISHKARFNYHLWEPHLLEGFVNRPIKLASTLGFDVPKGLSGKLIGEDYLVCVMSETHALVKKKDLSLNDILNYQHILITGGGDKNSKFDACLFELDVNRDIGLKIPFFSAAFNALIKTDFLLVTPHHIARNMSEHMPITYRSLPVEVPLQKYWLIWHPKYDKDASHQWIREQFYQIFRRSIYSVGYD